MDDTDCNVISLKSRKQTATKGNKDFSSKKTKLTRRREHLAAIGSKTHFYTCIPDPLNQAYIDGKVNDTLFRLIYTLLANGREFWITREYLVERFSDHTLKKYLPMIEKAKIVEVEKVVVTKGKGAANVYHTTHPDDWDMSLIVDAGRRGQKLKAADVQPCKKPNDSVSGAPSFSAARMQAAYVQPILKNNSPQNKEIKEVIPKPNPCGISSRSSVVGEGLPAEEKEKPVNMDILYSRMRLRYHPMISGDHTRALVLRMLQHEQERLHNLGHSKLAIKVESRKRVLACIETFEPGERKIDASHEGTWLRKLDQLRE